VAVISAALAVIATAGILYLQPGTAGRSGPLIPGTSRVLTGKYSVDYDFLTPSKGWAVVEANNDPLGGLFVFRTTDGATTWQKLYTGGTKQDPTYLHYFDDRNAFAYAGEPYVTHDGGAHWLQINVDGAPLFVTFASPNDGWAEVRFARPLQLYRTTDGGATWAVLPTPVPAQAVLLPEYVTRSSTFRGNGEGWLGAFNEVVPSVFMTADAGVSWQQVQVVRYGCGACGGTAREFYYDTSVRLMPHGGVVALVYDETGAYDGAFVSADRGKTWSNFTFPSAVTDEDDVTFLDASHWWLFRPSSAYTTDDGGRSWVQVAAASKRWTFSRGGAIDQRHAWRTWVSTSNSDVTALAMTSDQGAHWNMVNTPQP